MRKSNISKRLELFAMTHDVKWVKYRLINCRNESVERRK